MIHFGDLEGFGVLFRLGEVAGRRSRGQGEMNRHCQGRRWPESRTLEIQRGIPMSIRIEMLGLGSGYRSNSPESC